MQQHHQASFEDLPIDEDYRTPPRSRRRLWVGVSITIIAALCPLLAQLPVLNNLATTLWLVSLPLCFVGVALIASYLHHRYNKP